MHFFIDFWKLETVNSFLHVFSFLHKLNFKNSFCFLPILSCQTSFLVLKIENYFWKLKIKGKNSYQIYPYFFYFTHPLLQNILRHFIYSTHLFNKIFILFTFFIISFPLLSGTNSQTRLLHRATPTPN